MKYWGMIKLGASVLVFQCAIALPGAFFISAHSHHNLLFVVSWLAVAQLVSTHGLITS